MIAAQRGVWFVVMSWMKEYPSARSAISAVNLLVFLAVPLTTWSCSDDVGILPPIDVPVPITVPVGFTVDLFSAGLSLPTSIAFPPDGTNRLFVNELQSGRVRIIENGEMRDQSFTTVPTNTTGGFPVNGENGLLGIAFDPAYATNRYVYITYATRTDSGTFGTVARLTDVNNRGQDFTILLDGIVAAPGHQIESLAFGPDGKLYVSTGDAFLQDEAQDVDGLLGKILRMNPDGTVPADNPFPGSYTYAYGFRNSFDLVFDDTGMLWSTDNGTAANDEFNAVVAGGNYGWPLALGESTDPNLTSPLHVWREIVAPTGMVFYRSTRFPATFRGKMLLVLFGDTFTEGPSDRAKRVQIVDVTKTPPTFEDFAVYDFSGIGNPLDVAVGPNGSVFLSDIFRGEIYRIAYEG